MLKDLIKNPKIRLTSAILLGIFVLALSGYAIAGNKDGFFTAIWNKVSDKKNTGGTGKDNSKVDTDEDGLTDDLEKAYNTDPYNPDSDGDGYKDGVEIASGYDPKSNTKDKESSISSTENSCAVAKNSKSSDKEEFEEIELFNNSMNEINNITIDDLNKQMNSIKEYIDSAAYSLPKIEDKDIKISSKTGDEEVKKYLRELNKIDLKYSSSIKSIDLLDAIENQDGARIKKLRDIVVNSYRKVKNLEIPKEVVVLHRKNLSLSLALEDLMNEALDKVIKNRDNSTILLHWIGKMNVIIEETKKFNEDLKSIYNKYKISYSDPFARN